MKFMRYTAITYLLVTAINAHAMAGEDPAWYKQKEDREFQQHLKNSLVHEKMNNILYPNGKPSPLEEELMRAKQELQQAEAAKAAAATWVASVEAKIATQK